MRDVIVASDELIASAGYLADRISVNLEQENKIFEGQGVEAYEHCFDYTIFRRS